MTGTVLGEDDGHFTQWLDAHDRTVHVSVSHVGYQPHERTINLVKGKVVTTDFT